MFSRRTVAGFRQAKQPTGPLVDVASTARDLG
jgi:hypothetical protein